MMQQPMPQPPQGMPPQGAMPQGGSPQQNPNMMAFLQMLQQQGYPPKPNLMPPQQWPQGGPPQGGPPGQPPQGAPPQGIPPGGMQGQQAQMPQPQMQPQGNPMAQQGPAPQQQIPPQILQMLQQRMQQQGGQGGQPPQQGQPVQNPGMQRHTPQELAALGRLGDNTVAHLTKGEIAVPPQVQTPKVLATLKHAFEKKGAPPQNFVAGSPTSSTNPATGMPEYNFWSSVLPIALSVGGGILGGPLGAAAGGFAGSMIGGKDVGDSLLSGALSGVGDYGVGSILGDSAASVTGSPDIGTGADALSGQSPASSFSNLFSSGATAPASDSAFFGTRGLTDAAGSDVTASSDQAATNAFTNGSSGAAQAPSTNAEGISYNPFGSGTTSPSASASSSLNPAPQNSGINPMSGQNLSSLAPNPLSLANFANKYSQGGVNYGNTAGAALGSYLGNSMSSPSTGTQPQGFNTPYKNASQLPNWQTQIGQTNYTGPTPQFTGYNPATNFPAAYNFFPTGQQNQVPQA